MHNILIVYPGDIVGYGNRDRIINVCKAWHRHGHNVSILMAQSMVEDFSKLLLRESLNVQIISVPWTKAIKKLSYIKIVLSYIPRALFGCMVKLPDGAGIIYSMTGIITEVLPSFVFKLRRRKLKWIALIDNLVYPPGDNRRKQVAFVKLLAYLGFLISVRMCRKADVVLTVNEVVKNGLVRLGISRDKIIVTRNGIFLKDIAAASALSEIKYDGVFLGRVDYSKGIFSLIDMWKEASDISGRNLKLAIVGKADHAIEVKLKEKIREKRLTDNVTLHGYLSGIDKYRVLKSSNFFVFPSIDESWGIVLMEAIACGLPVLAYNLDAYKDIYPDGMIERVPVGDREGFVSKIVVLASDKEGTARAKRIDFAKNFNWEDIIEQEYDAIKVRLTT